MKLIQLNAWCGTLRDPLKEFISQQKKDTDIFCFQEVRNGEYIKQEEVESENPNLLTDLKSLLPDFNCYFVEMSTGVGIATFIRNGIEIGGVSSREILSTEDTSHIKMSTGQSYYARVMLSVEISNPRLIIHNFHGIPGNSKRDTPERKIQIDRILDELDKNKDVPQIIVGDFNLDMHTEAISRMEIVMKNLVKERGFKTTRNRHYKGYVEFPFADYVFVSKNLNVLDFEVLPDEVSDHSALMMRF